MIRNKGTDEMIADQNAYHHQGDVIIFIPNG